MPALRVVAGGGVYYPREVAAVLRSQPGPSQMVEALTEREREVLNGLMLGLTDQQIGRRLFVSSETVKTHVKHIYQKLAVDNRTKAVVKSIAIGLTSLEDAMAKLAQQP